MKLAEFNRKAVINDSLDANSTVQSVPFGVQRALNTTNLYLIHGCRTKNDCLYLDELNTFSKSGVLSRLKICYSRGDRDSEHIPDYLKSSSVIRDLILHAKETRIYVCGDQIKFPKDVCNALAELIGSEQILKQMQKEKRFLQDVWL